MRRSIPVSREARVTSAVSDLQSRYMTLPIASKTVHLPSACRIIQIAVSIGAVFNVTEEFVTRRQVRARNEILVFGTVVSTFGALDRVAIDVCQIVVASTGHVRSEALKRSTITEASTRPRGRFSRTHRRLSPTCQTHVCRAFCAKRSSRPGVTVVPILNRYVSRIYATVLGAFERRGTNTRAAGTSAAGGL